MSLAIEAAFMIAGGILVVHGLRLMRLAMRSASDHAAQARRGIVVGVLLFGSSIMTLAGCGVVLFAGWGLALSLGWSPLHRI
jgi:hypothetical protein